MEEKQYAKAHKLLLNNRRTGTISGVTDVISFDIAEILLETEQGMLTIKGADLHVNRLTLEKEYMRDKNKGLDIQLPKNYFPGDDSDNRPLLMWRAHANTLYTNWINYYVYQNTPYVWDDEE